MTNRIIDSGAPVDKRHCRRGQLTGSEGIGGMAVDDNKKEKKKAENCGVHVGVGWMSRS